MAHPYAHLREKNPGQKRAREMTGKHSDVAADKAMIKKAMSAHDKQLHGGKHTDLKSVGMKSGGRLDKYARGGKTKGGKGKKGGHTKINIMVAPKVGNDAGPAMPPPGMGAAPPPMPPKMPMGPPPGGPPGLPPGLPPGPMKRGGKVKMTGGADSGVGRLDKIKAYGKKAKGK